MLDGKSNNLWHLIRMEFFDPMDQLWQPILARLENHQGLSITLQSPLPLVYRGDIRNNIDAGCELLLYQMLSDSLSPLAAVNS